MRKRTLWAATGALVAALGGGGASLATGGDDHAISGPAADHARAAAIAHLGGGTGGSVELDGEHGATYDVEVHRGGGVDVWLDAAFKPLASEQDSEP